MEIVSDAFIFVLAGHDHHRRNLSLCSLLLTINLSSQFYLQADIDHTLGSRSISSLSYPNDMDALYNSMVGAVIIEVLRIIPPVGQFGKINREGLQQLTVDGKQSLCLKIPTSPWKSSPQTATLGIFPTGRQKSPSNRTILTISCRNAGSFLKTATRQQPSNNQSSQNLLMASKLVPPQQETARCSVLPKEHSFLSLKEPVLVLASDSHKPS
jgi:hypothetical protein